MILAVVKGNIVSTNKTEKLLGSKLLVVVEWDMDTGKCKGNPKVAIDLVGAGEGELVMCVSGSSARQTPETDARPVDMAITGIVDTAEVDGKIVYRKYPVKEDEPEEEVKVKKQAKKEAGK